MTDLLIDPEARAVWLLLLAVKGAVLLAAAEVALRLCVQTSASIRHQIRSLALIALIILPFLSLITPAWETQLLSGWLPRLPVSVEAVPAPEVLPLAQAASVKQPLGQDSAVAAFPAVEAGQPAEAAINADSSPALGATMGGWIFPPWYQILVLVWLAGTIICTLRLLLGYVSVCWAVARSRPAPERLWIEIADSVRASLNLKRPVDLRLSRDAEVALSVGTWRPRILLPEVVNTWSLPRLRSILLHEFAHVKRNDNWFNLAAQLACALYWFNPLVWVSARSLEVDRERACDDEVLAAGARPSEYAAHLLELVRAVSPRRFWGRLEISQTSALKNRFKALLNPHLDRRIADLDSAGIAVLLLALLLLPLAAVQPGTASAGTTDPESARNGGFLAGTLARNAGPGTVTDLPGPVPRFLVPEESRPSLARSSQSRPKRTQQQPRPATTDVWDGRSWPVTQVITTGQDAPPEVRDFWRAGPPHRFWGVGDSQPAAPAAQSAQRRLPLPLLNPGAETPADPPVGGGGIEEAPRRAVPKPVLTYHDLGTLGGNQSRATDINDEGLIAGQSSLASGLVRPFLWSRQEGMKDLGVGQESHSRAVALNEAGEVVCETFNSARFRGFIHLPWLAKTVDLGGLDEAKPFTAPRDLNEAGQVVGGSRRPNGLLGAFLWSFQEGMIDLETRGWSEAVAVNVWGQAVGFSDGQAFLWDSVNGPRSIAPPGSSLSVATDINNRGEVVGYANYHNGYAEAFYWSAQTGPVLLGRISDDYPISFALAINDEGHVIGRSLSPPDEGPLRVRVFRWTSISGMTDLGAGGEETRMSINAIGQIVGAYSDGSAEAESKLAVIWTRQGPVLVELDTASSGTSESEVAAVNNLGQITGTSRVGENLWRASLWEVRFEESNLR